jgi:hypothetical protein
LTESSITKFLFQGILEAKLKVTCTKPPLGPLVHKEGLCGWDEVVTSSALLVACNLGGLMSPHHQCQGKF